MFILTFAFVLAIAGTSAAVVNATDNATNSSDEYVGCDPIINGTVTINEYGQVSPLANATVVVNSNGRVVGSATTDENGYYSLNFYSTATYFNITTSYIGCPSVTALLNVTGNGTKYGTLNFQLYPYNATDTTASNQGTNVWVQADNMYGFAGILKVYVQNFGTVDAFCIDIFTPIDATDDLLVNGPLPGTAGDLSSEVDWGKVNYLLKTYYSSSMSSNEAAALQCAIWYFTSAPYGTYSAGKTKWQFLTYSSSINRNRYDGMTQSGSNSVVTRAWQMINAATSIDYPYQITLEPETTRVANEGSVTLTATVRDQNGDVMPGVTVNFSTDKGSITSSGTTNSNGQVTATLSGVPSNSTATVLAGVSGKYGNLLYDNPNDPAQNLVVPNLLAYTIRDYSYINFDATANVTLTQTVNGVTGSTPQVNVGDTVTYVVTATNTGPSTATGILISDIIPSGLSNVTVTASNGNVYYNSTTGIWTIESLSNGSSVTLTISGIASSAMAGLTTTNTANRTAQDQYNGKATSTSASVYTRKTDLVLSQTVNGQSTGSITGNVGDSTTYIVTVKNNGPDTATNINIKDTMPGLTGATIIPSVGTYNSTTGIWTIPTLASGSSAFLNITGLLGSSMAGLNTTNVANVTSQTEYDPTVAGSTSIPVYTKLANVTVTQTINNGNSTTANVGDTITYVITAVNSGLDAATGLQITDLLPSGLSNINYSINGVGTYNTTTGLWNIGTLTKGSTTILTITGKITAALAGLTTTNYANRTAQTEYNPSSNTTSTTLHTNQANVTISQTINGSSSATANVGDTITYVITATNHGQDAATGLQITDLLPLGLSDINYNTGGFGTYNSTTGLWNIGTLTSGTTATLTITAKITSALAGLTTTNYANRTAQTEYNPSTNTTNTTLHTNQTDLTLSQTVNGQSTGTITGNVGDSINYIVTVKNNGPDAATNISIKDIIPGLTGATIIPSVGTYNSTTGIWTIPTLASGSSAFLNITGLIGSSMAGLNTTNVANVTSQTEYDPTIVGSTGIPVYTKLANVTVTQTINNGSSATANVGDTITYVITAVNSGLDAATGLQITDLLPAGLSNIDYNTAFGTYNSTTGLWNIGILTSGTTATLTITAKITSALAGLTTTNYANRTAQNEYNPSNNSTSTTVYTNQANVGLTQTVNGGSSGTVNVGDTVTIIVTATNNGPDTASNINIAETLPAGFTPTSITPGSGSSYSSGVWTISSLASGANTTLTITGKATAAMAGLTTNNTVNRTSQSEYNSLPSGNTATIYTKLADVTLTQTGGYQSNVVTFTVTATNNGPDSATNIKITDLIPSGLTGVTVTPSIGTYNSTTGIWTIPELLSGKFATLTITGNATPTTTVTNTANKTNQTEYDPNTPDNTIKSTYVPQADIRVYNYTGNAVYTWDVNNDITWVVDVENYGPDDATGVIVTYKIPDGLTLYGVDTRSNGYYTYDAKTNTITWYIGFMPNWSAAYMDVFTRVSKSGTLTTTVTKIAENEYDPKTSNDIKSRNISVGSAADVAVTQTTNNTQPNLNDKITFIITVTNNGPDTATNINITYIIPTGLTGVIITPSVGTYNSTTGIWTIPTLTNGTNATLTINATVNTTGMIKNTAALLNVTQYNFNLNNDQQTIIINQGSYSSTSDIRVYTYTSTGNYVWDVNNDVRWVVDVENYGPDDATGIIVTYKLSDGLVPIAIDTRSNGYYTYDAETNTITWYIGFMPNWSAAYMTIFTRITQSGTLTTTVTKIAQNGTDPKTSNDIKSKSITVEKSADVAVTQTTNNTQPNLNDKITFIITVTNNGPDTATNINITYIIPTGLTGVIITPSVGTYNSTTGIWTIPTLTNGTNATLTINATVNTTGTIKNTAVLQSVDQFNNNINNDQQSMYVFIENAKKS